jgi:sugar phosphate isomerase/epimerase
MMTRSTRREFLTQAAAGTFAASGLCSFLPGIWQETIPIGVCTSVENASLIKRAGGDYIEEGVRRFLVPERSREEFDRRLETARSSGIRIRACNSFLPGSLKSTGPEADLDGILLYSETAFHRASEAGVKYIVFGSSGSRRIPDGFDRGHAREQFLHLLDLMGPLAADYGVTVAIEPLQKSECNFINTVTEGAAIVRAVNHPGIRLLADIFHMMREDEGPDAILGASDLIVHLHIAEKAERTPPGTAGDDFTPYFRALKEIGYNGLLSIECRWDDMSTQLPRAIRTVRNQLERVT